MRLVLVSLIVLCIGCKGQKEAMNMKEESSEYQEVELIVQDEYRGAGQEETLVFKSAKSLKSFFSKVNMTRKPGIPVPNVDFSSEIVVVYCSGKREDGAKPQIRKIRENDTEIVFSARHEIDKEKRSYTIFPFSLYKIPLTDKAIIFEQNIK